MSLQRCSAFQILGLGCLTTFPPLSLFMWWGFAVETITLNINPKARLLRTKFPTPKSRAEIPTPEHIYDEDAPGAQNPEAVWGWFKIPLQPLAQGIQRPGTLHPAACCDGGRTGFLSPCPALLVKTALFGGCIMEYVSADLGTEPCNCCGRMSRGYENIARYAINSG